MRHLIDLVIEHIAHLTESAAKQSRIWDANALRKCRPNLDCMSEAGLDSQVEVVLRR